MAEYHESGVPRYARINTKALYRSKGVRQPSKRELQCKASKMKAYSYVKQQIDANWKEGDRFIFSFKKKTKYSRLTKTYTEIESTHAGQSGTFIKRIMERNNWYVEVKWDDPTYNPSGMGKDKIGMFDFYHFAEKIQSEVVPEVRAEDISGEEDVSSLRTEEGK